MKKLFAIVLMALAIPAAAKVNVASLKVNHLEYKSKTVVGYITFYGVNLCDVLNAIVPKEYKNFVKDHDFVELELDDKIILFDASLYDYHINCTTYQ